MKFSCKTIFLLCLLATSCQSYYTPLYVDLGNQELLSFAREVKATDQLQLVNYGGGFRNGIDNFTLGFSSPKHPNIDEARFIYFDITNRFLDRVNQNETLRPYLVNYPFTMENLDLMILFPHETDGSIIAVGMGESFPNQKRHYLFYDGYDPSKQDFEIIHEELYPDAVNLYEQQKSKQFSTKNYRLNCCKS